MAKTAHSLKRDNALVKATFSAQGGRFFLLKNIRLICGGCKGFFRVGHERTALPSAHFEFFLELLFHMFRNEIFDVAAMSCGIFDN